MATEGRGFLHIPLLSRLWYLALLFSLFSLFPQSPRSTPSLSLSLFPPPCLLSLSLLLSPPPPSPHPASLSLSASLSLFLPRAAGSENSRVALYPSAASEPSEPRQKETLEVLSKNHRVHRVRPRSSPASLGPGQLRPAESPAPCAPLGRDPIHPASSPLGRSPRALGRRARWQPPPRPRSRGRSAVTPPQPQSQAAPRAGSPWPPPWPSCRCWTPPGGLCCLHFLCYICKEYVEDLAKIPKSFLQEANVTLIVIGQSSYHHIEPFCKLTGYSHEIYVDPEREIYKRLGMKRGEEIASSGDPAQQGGTLILGPGNNIHFIHHDRNRLDHKPINSVLQLVGVQHVDFTSRPSVIHV
ncbi:peroxiredoxin-like 2C isoform X2 [Bos taurus]|uniref:peroxiredoxin-like 2C isoform X2 n=1 Tax=Bos taurus TaxID=9913 RepID=UPI0028CBA80C|nr:peroxiredoxin-like 2C isoform X2 [Bos taurus]